MVVPSRQGQADVKGMGTTIKTGPKDQGPRTVLYAEHHQTSPYETKYQTRFPFASSSVFLKRIGKSLLTPVTMSTHTGTPPSEGMPSGGQLPPGMSPNVIFEDLPLVPNLAKSHGILMGLTFVVIFPLGSFIIRASRKRNMVWFHVGCQIVGWGMMLAGLAMGIKVAKILDLVSFDMQN